MSEFWQVLQLKRCSNISLFFVVAAVVCNSSEYLPWCFSNVRDALICRAGVFIKNICVKYFRAFAFVAGVVRNFFAGVGWFKNNVVFLKYGCYSVLEPYWTTTCINCCEIKAAFNFCFIFIFYVNIFIYLNSIVRFYTQTYNSI